METPNAHTSDPFEDCNAILTSVNELHHSLLGQLAHTREALDALDAEWNRICPIPNDPNGPDPGPYDERQEELEDRADVLKSILLKLDSAYGSIQWAGNTIAMEDIA